MIYGRKFVLQTDHKPFVSIFGSKKGIPIYAASRLQRWALTLTSYNFRIEYISTKNFGQADVLSRLIDETKGKQPDEVVIAANDFFGEVYSKQLKLMPVTYEEYVQALSTDETLQIVKNYVQTGWPNKCLQGPLKTYYVKKNEIIFYDKCLFLGERLIMPENLRDRVKKCCKELRAFFFREDSPSTSLLLKEKGGNNNLFSNAIQFLKKNKNIQRYIFSSMQTIEHVNYVKCVLQKKKIKLFCLQISSKVFFLNRYLLKFAKVIFFEKGFHNNKS